MLTEARVYALRTTDKDGCSYGGFQWPETGRVWSPDWRPDAHWGGGLHGLMNGDGESGLLDWSTEALWWVVAFDRWIDCGGKIKGPEAEILYRGDRAGATQMMRDLCPGSRIHGLIAAGGSHSTITGGSHSTLTGGDYSTLIGGDDSAITGGRCSTIIGGDRSAITGGDGSTLIGGAYSAITGDRCSEITGGDDSTLTGGDRSTVTGGRCSEITGGDRSTVIGGYRSAITGGAYSVITGGDRSVITGGDRSTLTGGDRSTLTFYWWQDRLRAVTVYPGENGIEIGKPYQCRDGKIVPAGGARA